MKYFFLLSVFTCALLANLPDLCAASTNLNWMGHWKGEDKREQLVQEIKKEFEFLYPEVSLSLTYDKDLVAPGNHYKWKVANTIVEMIRSGNIVWDVIMLDYVVYNYVAELLGDQDWGQKHLMDVGNQQWFRQSQKGFIMDTPYYREQTGGILVGPYIEGFITCLWYNRNVASQAGLEIRERKSTIEDFIGYARKLSEYNNINNSSIPFIKLGVMNRLEVLFEYLYKSQCPDPQFAIDQSYSREKEELFLKTLLFFEELAKYQPAVNADYETLGLSPWNLEFLDGDGLFIVAGTYKYSHFMGIDQEKFRSIVPIEAPVVSRLNGLVGDYLATFAIMKNSKNKDAAVNLFKLWSEPRVAEKWISYTKNPTGIKGHLTNMIPATMEGDVYSKFIIDMTDQYGSLPMRYFRAPTYIFGEKNPVTPEELRSKLAMILSGKLTARQYYDDVMKRFIEQ